MSLQDELHPTSGSPLHEASQSSSLGEKAETLPEQGGPAPSPPGSPSDSQCRTVAWQPPSGSEAAFPQIEGYQIIGRLGEGGMGVVWKAVQHGTHRTVALKLMNAASFGSQRAEQRFQREVDLTAALEHPSIARVYDGGQRGGVYFYAMELIDGQPLDRYVKHAGLSQRAIVELMLAVCEAVEFAHRKGVVHRDLKPANILVDKEGRPHVVDFGLAKALRGDDGSALTQDGGTVGTPCYMSPEQAAGDFEHLGAPSDVLLVGCGPLPPPHWRVPPSRPGPRHGGDAADHRRRAAASPPGRRPSGSRLGSRAHEGAGASPGASLCDGRRAAADLHGATSRANRWSRGGQPFRTYSASGSGSTASRSRWPRSSWLWRAWLPAMRPGTGSGVGAIGSRSPATTSLGPTPRWRDWSSAVFCRPCRFPPGRWMAMVCTPSGANGACSRTYTSAAMFRPGAEGALQRQAGRHRPVHQQRQRRRVETLYLSGIRRRQGDTTTRSVSLAATKAQFIIT